MGVNVPQAITEFWTQQFQGKKVSADDLAAELKANSRTDLADGRLDLIMLNDALGKGKATDQLLLKEVSRLLRLGGTLIIAGAGSNPGAKDLLKPHGLVLTETKRYASKVSHYDWKSIRFFTKGKV
jgi:SAM-dependent methyltransferase